jgi:hypothetical protein
MLALTEQLIIAILLIRIGRAFSESAQVPIGSHCGSKLAAGGGADN